MERTTSANSTVASLYSAGVADSAFGRNSEPHLVQVNAAVIGPTHRAEESSKSDNSVQTYRVHRNE
jgi:hypothetical protein